MQASTLGPNASTDVEELLKERASFIDKAIERYVPRRFDERAVIFQLNPPKYAYNLEALNKAIAEPVWDLFDRGGKRLRSSLFLLICEALGARPEALLDFMIIPEVIHNGTLIVDDVEDGSELRRGRPCTYKLFGLDVAINAGNILYYLPLLILLKHKEKIPLERLCKIYEVYVQEMINVSLGQAIDIAWHKGLANADEINVNDYLQMCSYKTGALMRMSVKMAAILAGANDEVIEKLGMFAESIGISFQIRDDMLDLIGEEFAERKGGRGQDITEGKRTLMVVYTLNKASQKDRERLLEILHMHTSDQRLRDEAIGIMKKYKAIEEAERLARELVIKGWKEAEGLLPNSEAKARLKALVDYMIERKV